MTRRPSNRFLGEVRERDGIGLRYETSSGHTGVVWLVEPSDPARVKDARVTVLGQYFEQPDTLSCQQTF